MLASRTKHALRDKPAARFETNGHALPAMIGPPPCVGAAGPSWQANWPSCILEARMGWVGDETRVQWESDRRDPP